MDKNDLEYHAPGSSCANLGNSPFWEWLKDFPYEQRVEIESWLNEDITGGWLVPPIPLLSELRSSPFPGLELIFKTLEHLWRVLPPPGRIVWALENYKNRGLDDFEVEAVFSKWVVIQDLVQINQGEEKSKIVLAGTFREERIGLSFVLPKLNALRIRNLNKILSIIQESKVPVACIFLSSPIAKKWSRNPLYFSLKKKIRYLLEDQFISLALWVPKERTKKGLFELESEMSPLGELGASSHGPHLIRFAEVEALNPPTTLARSIAHSPIECDCSMGSTDFMEQHDEINNLLQGPYFQSGAFQSQIFDIRVPIGSIDPSRKLEIITTPLRSNGRKIDVKKAWAKRLGVSIEGYTQLLDFRRMEKYFQSYKESLELQQNYHQYRIYNWPPGDPSPRVTLFDCGNFNDPDSIAEIMSQFSKMQENAGRRWKIVGQSELIEVSWEEARQRVATRNRNQLAHQGDAHQYLKTLPWEGRLREDVRNFVEFLPTYLGHTLEIGSGNGQLASILCHRAIQYICLDLNIESNVARDDRNQLYGLRADINSLPLISKSFDTVIANNILEHSSDPLKCLQEIWRVLKPGGKIYALIPLDALNVRHQIRTHYWVTDMQGIANVFQMASFSTGRVETINLYKLGVAGCFPSCNGLVAKIEAEKLERSN